MSAPTVPMEREERRQEILPPKDVYASTCASALYLVSGSLSSASAASGSPPFFLTPSPQVLDQAVGGLFQSPNLLGVSLLDLVAGPPP